MERSFTPGSTIVIDIELDGDGNGGTVERIGFREAVEAAVGTEAARTTTD